MKNIVLIAIVLTGFYFGYWKDRAYKSDFVFNGEVYQHATTKSGGDLKNYFYTPRGTEMETARQFIQIIRFGDQMPRATWPDNLGPLINQYNLKPVRGEALRLAGSTNRSGIFFNSYAVPVKIGDEDLMAFYVTAVDEEQNSQPISKKSAVIDELASIRLD